MFRKDRTEFICTKYWTAYVIETSIKRKKGRGGKPSHKAKWDWGWAYSFCFHVRSGVVFLGVTLFKIILCLHTGSRYLCALFV